jgi:FtsP/CotA-like multicopper oxidase with cupredoxin domain
MCAYPYLEVGRKAYRFRILNASNERYYNLQLYFAESNAQMWNPDGTLRDAGAGEVPMVPAIPDAGYPDRWSTDGRTGGVPSPAAQGPVFIQICNEGGFLPAPAVLENTPIGYIYNRRDVTVLNVDNKTLFLGPAERADVVIDFSQVPNGSNIILYNDSPAPVPGFDPRVDYYTGDPDQTEMGGAPTTQPGYGPNMRTLMHFRVLSSHGVSGPYDLAALKAALPVAYGKTQPPPIVPNAVYNAAFGQQGPEDSYARIQDTSLAFFNGPLQGLKLTSGGSGYRTAPTVVFTGGGTGAAAVATIGGVTSINVVSGGSGYTSAPTVSITGGGGTGATAAASLTGILSALTITNPGIGYLTAPTIAITGGGGTGAAATAKVFGGRVVSITITNPGSGYTGLPVVAFTGGGGIGAAAAAVVTNTVAAIAVTNGGSGYRTVPTVVISGGGGTGAAATATIAPDSVTGLTLTSPGSYTSAPVISFAGGGGTGAAAVAIGWNMAMYLKSIVEEFDPDYGRMNAMLGLEVPNTLTLGQNSLPYTDIDPPTELFKIEPGKTPYISPDAVQLWVITHNGVDTHVIHWHLFNVQLINRVGWDGAISPPDDNEVGWKDTIRMNPLQNCIVAIRPVAPVVPFELVNSIRALDVTMPLGSTQGFMNFDPLGEPAPVTNTLTNFGWEYMWHCHMLGHEEFIMMRSMGFAYPPVAPGSLAASAQPYGVNLTWRDNSVNETDWIVERALAATGPWSVLATVPTKTGPATGATVSYTDNTATRGTKYWYRISASNTVGYTQVYAPPTIGYPTVTNKSLPSNTVTVVAV